MGVPRVLPEGLCADGETHSDHNRRQNEPKDDEEDSCADDFGVGTRLDEPPGLERRVAAEARRPVPLTRAAFLELFAGCGILTESVRARGVLCLPAFDIADGPMGDLTRPGIRAKILGWIRGARAGVVWVATPCSAFSVARKGVRNLPRALQKDEQAASHAWFIAELVSVCLQNDVPFVIEIPLAAGYGASRP